MLHNMKILSLKKSSAGLFLLITAGLLGIILFMGKMCDYLIGPQHLTSESFAYEEGQYVEYDLDDVIVMDCFLERNDTDVKGNVTSYYYYILGVADKKNKTIRCIVAMTEADKKDLYDSHNKYFKSRLRGKSPKSPGNFVDRGTMVPMTQMMENKIWEYLSGYYNQGFDTNVYCEPYYIIPYEPGVKDLAVCILSLVLILCALLELLLILAGFKQRGIKKYIARTLSGGIRAAEEDYAYSRFFNKSIRIGDIYFYILQKEGVYLIENKKLLWAYECTPEVEKGRGFRPDAGYSGIEIWDTEFNHYEIYMHDRKMIESILDYIVVQFPYAIVGYNNTLCDLFFNHNREFKDLVFNQYSRDTAGNGGNV